MIIRVFSRKRIIELMHLGHKNPSCIDILDGSDKPWALISIRSGGENEFPALSTVKYFGSKLAEMGCAGVLELKFGDISRKDEEEKDHPLFSEYQAVQILDFVKLTNVDRIILHCNAGISRSGAVGVFLCRYFGLDDAALVKQYVLQPNQHVLNTLMCVSGLRDKKLMDLEAVFGKQ